jgi:hypothetical protein
MYTLRSILNVLQGKTAIACLSIGLGFGGCSNVDLQNEGSFTEAEIELLDQGIDDGESALWGSYAKDGWNWSVSDGQFRFLGDGDAAPFPAGSFQVFAGSFGDIPGSTTLGGDFSYLGSYTGASSGASGSVQVTITGGTTTIDVSVSGLEANESYPAHLHAAPCADGAGGHYMDDPNGGVNNVNEAWPAPSCDASGECTGYSQNSWEADVSVPRSVVVHDLASLGKPKMLCADLVAPSGSSTLSLYADATTVKTSISGLRAGVTYPSHLHADTCANSGGGHYMDDPNGGVNDVNEAWPAVTDGSGSSSNAWAADMSTARSIVIHNTVANGKGKMLCADLSALAPIGGSANLIRNFDGSTRGTLVVTGLEPNTFYASHLHAADCTSGPGPHYLTDDNAETAGVNALWPGFTTDGSGKGVADASMDGRVSYRDLRAGLSFVIHDTANSTSGAGAKMLCADLSKNRTARGTSFAYNNADGSENFPNAKLRRDATATRSFIGKTTVRLKLSGLNRNTVYPAHVHETRCAANNGGGHYVREIGCENGTLDSSDPACQANPDTELWVGFTTNRRGKGNVSSSMDGIARADAKSIVVHNCLDANGDEVQDGVCASKPRALCIDLE